MENQIQLYHDATAFWLDKEWKTPREKELEREVARLRQQNQSLKAQVKAQQDELQPLKVFKDIPCCKCGEPLTGWTRSLVREGFKDFYHSRCG